LHHVNPASVTFDADEVDKIMRIRMARWLGIAPGEWDDMSIEDQGYAIEIARAEREIEQYDIARLRQGR
jgi:hypothetical protein